MILVSCALLAVGPSNNEIADPEREHHSDNYTGQGTSMIPQHLQGVWNILGAAAEILPRDALIMHHAYRPSLSSICTSLLLCSPITGYVFIVKDSSKPYM